MKAIILLVGTAVLLFGALATKADAAPAIPPTAVTYTDVCMIYSIDGIFSGGVAIRFPETVSVLYLRNFAFLWYDRNRDGTQERLQVDTIAIAPLGNGCFGIF